MRQPIAKGRTPYGGLWITTDRLTGLKVQASNWDSLVNQIVQGRRANNHPIGLDLQKEIEQWICEDMPNECEDWNPAVPQRPRELGIGDVLRGTMVAFSHLLHGRPTVSKEEAERRAAICCSCRYRVPIRGGCSGGCGPVIELMRKIIGNVPALSCEDEIKTKACWICGCDLKSAVWTELNVQAIGVPEHMRKQFASLDWCWKRDIP